MATAHTTIDITGDDAMLVYKAAKIKGVSIRRFVVDAAAERAREVLSTPRLIVDNDLQKTPTGK